MKKHIPYFSFYPSDFMNGVRGLTPQDVGVYTMLLCRIYEENGPVEYHTRRLATYCGMREASFTKVAEKLIDLGKLTLVDGKIFNGRAAGEIAKRANDLKMASEAGKASAKKRQGKQTKASTPVERPFNHTDTNTDTVREVTNVPSLALVAQREPEPPDRFSEFWNQYPHRGGAKKGKAAAEKAWAKAIKARASPQQIIAGALRYANDRQVIQGYAKDPATWLNAKGWEDDIERDSNHNSTPHSRGMAGSATASEIADRGARWAASRAARC